MGSSLVPDGDSGAFNSWGGRIRTYDNQYQKLVAYH